MLGNIILRTFFSILTSFLIVIFIGKFFINLSKIYQFNAQPIRQDGPKSHLKKTGTPTMGGAIILFSIIISFFLWCNIKNIYCWIAIICSTAFSSIGFYDDFFKIKNKNNKGLSIKLRLILEFIIAIFVSIFIYLFITIDIFLPFVHKSINLGVFFIPLSSIFIVVTANAVNFTDGLDGLAIINVIISALILSIFCYFIGNDFFAKYYNIPYIIGANELTVLLGTVLGSSIGFLWFNSYPSTIFMGDTGSLFFGSILSIISIIIKNEIILFIVGGIFFIEAISVIIQVIIFKINGNRFFLMAPLHHHFEKMGLMENKIVMRFSIMSIIFALFSLISLKI